MDDVKPEVEYKNLVVVCYILGIKPPFRIIDGFIRRLWKQFGMEKVAMLESGVFIVRFRSLDEKNRAMDVGPIFYDRKPVIVKNWSPELDIKAMDVRVVPTWIKLPGLPLKFWGQNS